MKKANSVLQSDNGDPQGSESARPSLGLDHRLAFHGFLPLDSSIRVIRLLPWHAAV